MGRDDHRRHGLASLRLLMLMVLATAAGGTRAAPGAGPPEASAGSDPGAVARQVIAGSIGVAPDRVRIISIQARSFADGSLDCPRPGEVYTQAIVAGHVVLAEASGRRFDVRVVDGLGRICHGRGPAAGSGRSPKVPVRGSLQADAPRRAHLDLAAALGLPPEEVAITGSRPARAGEPLPGCTVRCDPGGAGGCGTVVSLAAAGRDYRYLVQGDEIRACPGLARR